MRRWHETDPRPYPRAAALAGAGVGLAVGVVAEEAFASGVIAFKEIVTK